MEQANPLKEGDKAPAFSFRDADGVERSTTDLAGSPYLVFFYPKDNTPGCTVEACGFRNNLPELGEFGITVIGVSCDSEKSHEKFRAKRKLPFPLAADVSREIVKAFGVWGEKSFMGRKYEGIHRMSFLVAEDGHVAKTYRKVKVKKHPTEVLADARSLFG
jgi:peroxiredoxin Q/BCP